MYTGRHLFDINHGGRRLTVSRTGSQGRRMYIGAINGQECAAAPAKGELLRTLIQMARHFPKSSQAPRTGIAG